MAMSGTTATLLARRWESAVLVNVDNATLQRLMNNPEAMKALMNIEGFRNLNSDIETIINKSEHVKKTKKEKGESLTAKEKKELTDEEKEYKSKRKEIQEKLIKFATRIPVFMYLTDFREYSLKDVIMQLEPELNDAVYKFKRYEDSSLNYAGIDKHTSKVIGGWDTVMEITEEKDDEADNVISQSEEQVAPDVQEEPEVKPWESLDVGDKVMHKSLGEGIIVSLDDNYLFVRFKDRESKFLYPNAFENGYLSR